MLMKDAYVDDVGVLKQYLLGAMLVLNEQDEIINAQNETIKDLKEGQQSLIIRDIIKNNNNIGPRPTTRVYGSPDVVNLNNT